MELTFASYNIRKAVGLDRRRDPERILSILSEIDADVVALQEADRRIGRRESVLPLGLIAERTDYHPAPLFMRPDSIGWHGNALLVKRSIEIVEAHRLALPTLEPRGAVRADLAKDGRCITVIGMHLDLSGLRRRRQVRAILDHLAARHGDHPAVLMGDMNEWSGTGGALREFGEGWRMLSCGRSFPSRRPVATLDRVFVSNEWRVSAAGVHHSALAARGSDHLPVWARLRLPKI